MNTLTKLSKMAGVLSILALQACDNNHNDTVTTTEHINCPNDDIEHALSVGEISTWQITNHLSESYQVTFEHPTLRQVNISYQGAKLSETTVTYSQGKCLTSTVNGSPITLEVKILFSTPINYENLIETLLTDYLGEPRALLIEEQQCSNTEGGSPFNANISSCIKEIYATTDGNENEKFTWTVNKMSSEHPTAGTGMEKITLMHGEKLVFSNQLYDWNGL